MGEAKPVEVKSGQKVVRSEYEDKDLAELDEILDGEVLNDNELTIPPIPVDEALDYNNFTKEQKKILRECGVKNSKAWNNLLPEE